MPISAFRSILNAREPVFTEPESLSRMQIIRNALFLRRTCTKLPVIQGRIVVHRLSAQDHYYIKALAQALQTPKGERFGVIRSTLADYKNRVTITSCSQRLGLPPGAVPELDKAPPWFIIYPWIKQSIKQSIEHKNQETLHENQRDGINLDAWQGGASYPLAHKEKLESEARKLEHLLSSVESEGYRPEQYKDGGIGATLMVNESGKRVWYVSGGFHRVCVLAALGYSSVPAAVARIVRRDHVNRWPLVRTGLFSKQAALDLFDQVFEGKGFAAHNDWMMKR